MSQKRYSTFRICDSDTAILAKQLAEKLNSLIDLGWNIERVDYIENKNGCWNDKGFKYDTTHEYIILTSVEKTSEEDENAV